MPPTREEAAWLAGLFEGEGSVHIGRRVQIALEMTDEDVVLRFGELVGFGRLIPGRPRYRPDGTRKKDVVR